MDHKPLCTLLLLTGAAMIAPLAAAEDNDLDRCAELDSDAARLACFDAVMQERQTGAPAAAPAAGASPTERPTEAPPAPVSGTTTPAAAEAPATPPAEPAAKQKPRKEYTAVVTAMRTRPHGQVVVTLDNGEAWSEQYASRRFLVEVGDTVTMKKARFSSAYRLIAPGGRAYTMTRVDE